MLSMGITEDRSPLKILKEGRAWYSNAPPPAKPSRASGYVSGRFTSSIDKLRGVGSFFKLTVYPAYSKPFFLAESGACEIPNAWQSCCSRNKMLDGQRIWRRNATGVHGGELYRHLELMRIVRHADRPIAESGPSEGSGCLPPDLPRPIRSA